MKREKAISALWSALLSFGLSAASIMCMVTAYDMKVDTGLILQVCAAAAVLCSLCYSLPLGAIPVGAGALILGYLWRNGSLEASLEAVLNRLSRQFHLAYQWNIIRWSLRTADEMEPGMVTLLCIFGGLIAMAAAWSVSRGKPTIPALLLSLVCVGSCFIVTDTVPDIPWLFLLLFSVLMLLLTSPARRQDAQQGNRLSLLAAPAAALALLALFAAIPQQTYSGQANAKKMVETIIGTDPVQLLLGHAENAGSAIADSNSVDLRSVGYRISGRAQVMEVTAPFTGTVYLRSKAMDAYDGVSWTYSGDHYSLLNWPNSQLEAVGELTITTRFAHRMLYMPYYTNITDMRDVTVGIENEKELTQYSFTCRRLSDPELVSKLYASPSAGQTALQHTIAQHIHLTPQMQDWASEIAANVTDGLFNPYHKAQAIAAYVRNSAKYDTETPRMPGTEVNFAKWFLEESDTGYCIHFATATTVLLQAAGIPARYVTGYMAEVTEGAPTPILANQAHAWAEYWLPGYGWTVLESTPAEVLQEQQESTAAASNATEGQTQPTDNPSADTQIPDTPGNPTAPGQQQNPDKQTVDLRWLLPVVLYALGGAALIAAIEGQRRLRRHLRQKKLDSASPNEKALLYWQLTTVYARLLKRTPDKALFFLAEKAKFSHYTLTDSELQQFETYLRSAKETLRRHNIFRRLYYRFVLAIC